MGSIEVTFTVVLDVEVEDDAELENVASHAFTEYLAENGTTLWPTSVVRID